VIARLTEQADQVVVRAQDEARMMGHESLQGEHLLLGLLSDQEGIPSRVFADLGIWLEPARDLVRERLGPGFGPCPGGPLPISTTAKAVLEVASRAALAIQTAHDELGEVLLGPEHLLLAIARDRESGANEVLRAVGADPDLVRFEVKKRASTARGERASHGPELRQLGSPLLRASADDARLVSDAFLVDPGAQRVLAASARIAFSERRARIGQRDLLRALTRDAEASQQLADLGVDLDLLRDRQ
jgi:ATP-dependent Clp protease ATP-binding subunit ClpC